MARYVDGFVLVVPKKNIPAYRRMAAAAGKVWMEYGALQFVETAGDDLNIKDVLTFPRLAKTKASETVVFSFIVYKSRAHRDRVNAKVMKDPRILRAISQGMPCDPKRMAYGGFKTLVDLERRR